MSKLIKFEVKSFKAARLIGKQVTRSINPDSENPIPKLWDSMCQDGTLEFIKSIPERSTEEPDTVGWMGDFNPESKDFLYIAGVLTRPGTSVPEGYVFRDIPDCEMGIAWIQGIDENGDLYSGASEHTAKARDEIGYEYDYSAGAFEMEYYSNERYAIPSQRGEKVLIMDYYSPSRKKNT